MGTCNTVEESITVTVDQTESSITSATASTNNVCPSTSVDLTANGVTAGSGATLTWFSGAGGTGSNLGTDNPLTVTPATTTTYFARLAGTCNTVEESITVTVEAIDITVTQNGNTLIANEGATGVTYQWIDCNNSNSLIAGAIDETYVVPVNGNYAVIINSGNCIDTSLCINVILTSVQTKNTTTQITTYPNPTRGELTITLETLTANATVIIYNTLGEQVLRESIINKVMLVDLSTFDKGVYLMQLQNGSDVVTQRIIKQ